MRPIGSPETSVRNQLTLHNIPEDDRIQVNAAKVYDLASSDLNDPENCPP